MGFFWPIIYEYIQEDWPQHSSFGNPSALDCNNQLLVHQKTFSFDPQ